MSSKFYSFIKIKIGHCESLTKLFLNSSYFTHRFNIRDFLKQEKKIVQMFSNCLNGLQRLINYPLIVGWFWETVLIIGMISDDF